MSRPSFGRALWQLAFTAIVLSQCAVALGQLPFFPGAEGFGGTWLGAAPAGGWLSNATVYRVTNLNDDGPGSFRGAFVENTSNKIIVFDVGGVIQLTSDSLDIKNVQNYYIAGQTAPSPVTIYGDTTQITHSNNKVQQNVILRYLTFRKGTGNGEDAITFAGGGTNGIASNMIMDHVSGSWAEDEVLSVANYNSNVTVQYSVIADSLTSGHAYGSLIRPRTDASVTFHHNLYANNVSRQARFGTYDAETLTADFRNNVIYNFRDRASYAGGSSEDDQEFADINYVGNYIVAGPGTVGSPNIAFSVDKNIDARVYQSGNFIDSDKQLNPGGSPNGANTGWNMFRVSTPVEDQTLTQMASPFPTAPVTTQTAPNAFEQVLDHVGNFWWSREAIDTRIIGNVRNNTGPPNGVAAAAPNAAELSGLLATPVSSHAAGYDADNDGMKDEWEAKHGGNLVWNADFDNDGYINLIEFVNELGEFPAPAPLEYRGGANGRYAQITNWRTNDGSGIPGSNWQPSKYDVAVLGGTSSVVVDAIGQHAGVLQINHLSHLTVSSGWLEVAERTEIAAHHSHGLVTVNGPGATRLNTGDLIVGSALAHGTLNILAGTVNSDEVVIAPTPNSEGVVQVWGANARWNVAGDMQIGVAGTATVSVLDGGEVTAHEITIGSVGEIQGDGVVRADVFNNGFVRSIGPVAMTIDGDLTQGSFGVLAFKADSDEFSTKLLVDGDIQFGGYLNLSFQPQYVPDGVATFDLIDWTGTRSGNFDFHSLPALDASLEWDTSLLNSDGVLKIVAASIDVLAGDYNNDGSVDAADYTVWRNAMGGIGSLENETASIGTVDGDDYTEWKANFGNIGNVGGGGIASVPEPSTIVLMVLVIAAAGVRRFR
jgi:T5SS/PEP-CTERM-associated repeat protein